VTDPPRPGAPAVVEAAGLAAAPDDELPPPDPERIVDLLARALASLHDLDAADPGGLPVLTVADVVARARRALGGGWRPDPAGPYAHMAAPRLLEVLESGAEGAAGPLVITHGRPSVDGLRIRAGAPALVGWEHVAVADPYRDLAAAARDLSSWMGPMLVPLLFERYQAARPTSGDPAPGRLDWYVLAGQFTS
jgi:aminoglycoside phosphotransferase